jgi:hypothetical protein
VAKCGERGAGGVGLGAGVGVRRGLLAIGVAEVTGGDVTVRRTLFTAGRGATAAGLEGWSMVEWVVQPVIASVLSC